jgi:hypothetical protein
MYATLCYLATWADFLPGLLAQAGGVPGHGKAPAKPAYVPWTNHQVAIAVIVGFMVLLVIGLVIALLLYAVAGGSKRSQPRLDQAHGLPAPRRTVEPLMAEQREYNDTPPLRRVPASQLMPGFADPPPAPVQAALDDLKRIELEKKLAESAVLQEWARQRGFRASVER